MNTKRKTPQAEARSESRIAAALEGLGCHGSGRSGGLGFAGGGCIKVATSKRLTVSGAEEHHAGMWDAVTLPIADARHGETEHAGHLCGATETVNDLGRGFIHGHILAQAKIKSKPKLSLEKLG